MKRTSPREKSLEKKPGQSENVSESKVDTKTVHEVKSKEFKEHDKLDEWIPKTQLGKKVFNGEINDIDNVLDSGLRLLESEVVDKLLELEVVLMEVGRAKGKFGGGKGSIWRQTQKKTKEGNRLTFSTFALVGNRDGYVGVGFNGAKETVPAREKAIRTAKLNLVKIRRGCGSWDCGCKEPHSIPYTVEGKIGSSRIVIMPAPKGAGLVVEERCRKILELAGIKDAYSKSYGQTNTKLNMMKACYEALKNLTRVKLKDGDVDKYGIKEGKK